MGAYMGVGSVENAVKPRLSNPTANGAAADGSENRRRSSPFQTAKSTLRSFLHCKGCRSVAAIVDGFDRDLGTADNGGGEGAIVGAFADELVGPLVDAVIQDFPQLLARLLGGFQPYLNASSSSASSSGNLVAAVAFSARLAQEDSESVDAALAEKAIENLLSALTWKGNAINGSEEEEVNEAQDGSEDPERISVKVLCIKSLACYKLRQGEEEREVKNYGALILGAFLEVVGGEDLKSDLNHNALLGLDTLLKKDVVAEADVQRVIGEISTKVSRCIFSKVTVVAADFYWVDLTFGASFPCRYSPQIPPNQTQPPQPRSNPVVIVVKHYPTKCANFTGASLLRLRAGAGQRGGHRRLLPAGQVRHRGPAPLRLRREPLTNDVR